MPKTKIPNRDMYKSDGSAIRPCPFCASFDVKVVFEDQIKMCLVTCQGCHAEGPHAGAITQAITLWNKRQPI